MSERIKKQEILIYKGKNGKIELKTNAHHDTVWATLDQIATLFDRDKSVISRHLKNIFSSGELIKNSVVAKNATTARDGKNYSVEYYNLDAILSVGYRVNSQKATLFRKWATSVLKEHVLKGYTVNKKLLEKTQAKLSELNKMISFITKVRNKQLSLDEATGLLAVINDYANSWILLQKYDSGNLTIRKGKKKNIPIEYDEAKKAIAELKRVLMQKGEVGDMFGQEREKGVDGILKTIYQTFEDKELYESLDEKAAHLLYFIIKDHPLIDGNKRTASLLFILFLQKNEYLFRTNGERKINDTALTALALFIAESKPEEKDQMVALITQLLK